MMAFLEQVFKAIKALLQLTRFWNLVIIGLAQLFTAYFLIDPGAIYNWKLFLLSFCTILIAAGGYIINDYYDIKIDLINKPDRVVIGKGITRRYAIFFHTLLSVSGSLLGLLLGWKIAAINFLSAFLLWLYSNNLKRQPFIGNLVVAVLTGLSILLVNILFPPPNSLVIIYAVFAFAMTLIREIIKDMEDWRGDNTFGCKTLPIVWGMRKTKRFLYFLLIVFVASILMINQVYARLPIYYFVMLFFIPLLYFTARLIRADTIKDFTRLSSLCKVIMLLGILTMALV